MNVVHFVTGRTIEKNIIARYIFFFLNLRDGANFWSERGKEKKNRWKEHQSTERQNDRLVAQTYPRCRLQTRQTLFLVSASWYQE